MKRFDLHGWRSLPLAQVAQRLTALLGIPLELHDSDYLGGEYYRGGDDAVEEPTVQPNVEDEDGYLMELDFPGVSNARVHHGTE